jgi:UDP-N-acetyl-D-galactosamine dehydrogenase
VVDVISRLQWLGHDITVHDPLADAHDAREEYGLEIDGAALERRYDVVLAAVPHRAYRAMEGGEIEALVKEGGLVADLHGIWRDRSFKDGLERWSL